jgi:hypothetical protein
MDTFWEFPPHLPSCMSKGQALQQHERRTELTCIHLTLYLRDKINDYSLFPPYLVGGARENYAGLASPLIYARGGAGGVAGWVLPCHSALLTRGGQGTALINDKNLHILRSSPRYLMSQALCSQDLSSLT